MNLTARPGLGTDTEELQSALEGLLAESTGEARKISRLERQPYPFTTSFPLDELRLEFESGEPLELLFKDLSSQTIEPIALRAKPQFLRDPRREIVVYRSLLNLNPMGTAFCYGSIADENSGRYWLFLERIAGRELYQIGDVETWSIVARWLARLHHRFNQPQNLFQHVRNLLIRFDAAYYRQWFERAERFLQNTVPPENVRHVRRLARHADNLIADLIALPACLIHGEFYASNVLVQQLSGGLRICPVDWERAAIGPGLVDLAALVSGKWQEDQKRAMALEYRDEMLRLGADAPPPAQFFRQLDVCRLHLAIQWLGWSNDWSPPQEHRYDWLTESLQLAQRLGVW